jgi:putative DNA primase/helicase
VTAIETEEGRCWAESEIKRLTAGDLISARFMRQDFFEYVPQFKLVIAGNHKPTLRPNDEATRRRLQLAPFTVTIPAEERDKELTEKLRPEWGGILQWMIDGCLAWQKQGLNPPAIVLDATEQYIAAEDGMGQWLAECCQRGSGFSSTVAQLFGSWRDWCSQNGENEGSLKRFSQNLEARGFKRDRDSGNRIFRGIATTQLLKGKPAKLCSE